MTDFDPQQAITAWANREHELKRQREYAQAFRDISYQTRVLPLDNQLAVIDAALKTEEAALRDALAAYVADSGDLHPHEMVTVRRVHPLRYDKDAALKWAEEHAPYLLRVKKELDVRKFEDAVKNGRVQYDGAETVNEVQIVIGKLGHLVEQKSEGE